MVEQVVLLLNGRGHGVTRARDANLSDVADDVVAEYALLDDLVIVTFDPDFRRNVVRRGCRCLLIRPPEVTARDRLAQHFVQVRTLFAQRRRLVVLPVDGEPYHMDG